MCWRLGLGLSFVAFFLFFLQRKIFFSPDVNASRVRKRTIRSKRTREANGAKRPAWPISKCMRTRTRVRACVHFHRARRNCKVAYMQGVKPRGRSFDPRSMREDRDIDSLQRQILSRVAFSMSIFREWLRHRVAPYPVVSWKTWSSLAIDEVWRKSFIATVNLRSSLTSSPSSLAIKHEEKLCTDICDEITVN